MHCFGIWSSSDKWLTWSIIWQGSPLFREIGTNNILVKIPSYLYRLPCSYLVPWDLGSLVPRGREEETPWEWGPRDTSIDTAVKRKSMRNALVPGRRPRKFPALKFHWNQCRTGVSGKKKSTRVINLLKWSEVLQTEGFRFNGW